MPKTKKVKKEKAWAIVDEEEVLLGSGCSFKDHQDEYFLAVAVNREDLQNAKHNHPEFYRGTKIVPITISYQVPPKRSKE